MPDETDDLGARSADRLQFAVEDHAAVSPVDRPSARTDDDDAALMCAREVLDGTVCECGHLNSEHGGPFDELTECIGDLEDDETCGCCQFTPVAFVVERVRRRNYVGGPGRCDICDQEKPSTAIIGGQTICDDCFYRLRDVPKG